jgi:superfamily II DNA or RNA helicase
MCAKFLQAPKGLGLWEHQEDAVAFIVNHLQQTSSPCLVRMPTGTGKTGVIATVAMLCAQGRTLVLTPWTNLRYQVVGSLQKSMDSIVSLGRWACS